MWAVAGLVAVVAAVSFALSASALVAVAGWAGVHGRLAWCVPVLADGGALAFSLAALVRREQGRGTAVEWVSLGVLAAVSVAANVAHAMGGAVAPSVRVAVGVAVVGVAPVVVLVATHTLAGLVAPHVAPASAPVADVAQVDDTEPVHEPERAEAAHAAPVLVAQAGAAVAAAVAEPVPAVAASVADVAQVAHAAPSHELRDVATVPPAEGAPWSDVPLWGELEPQEADDRGDLAAMRAMRNSGATLREVGAAFGVHASTVKRRLSAAPAGAVLAGA
ncbi:DUF2637 domain-containing protein [Xylanimonas protaetiae]|uniref:DUF2637 domain-containing protein n=1 Tax=Xylanimonas protaetiae TaxID=2509457 RepID=UPI002477FD86|nr:DUF2637 domain-containing protein [Xylanimonas protaetiae]